MPYFNLCIHHIGKSNCQLSAFRNDQDQSPWEWGDFLQLQSQSDLPLRIIDPDSSGRELVDSDGDVADEFFIIIGNKAFSYGPGDDVDRLAESLWASHFQRTFHWLKSELKNHFFGSEDVDTVKLINKHHSSSVIQLSALYSCDNPGVKWVLSVHEDLTLTLLVHHRPVEKDHDFWLGLPVRVFSVNDVSVVISKLCRWSICQGNCDSQFVELVGENIPLCTSSLQKVSYREGYMGAEYSSTIRTVKCQLLLRNGSRCSPCSLHRKVLWKRLSRSVSEHHDTDLVSSHIPHSHMSKAQMATKIEQLKKKNKEITGQLEKLRRDVYNEIKDKGKVLSELDNKDLITLLQKHKSDVEKCFPDENCLQRLFWEQQLKYAQSRSTKAMRWHPMIIRWCLYLQHKSAKAYEAIRGMGFIGLPSTRTLFDYSRYLPNRTGFAKENAEHLKAEGEALGLFDENCHWKRYVGLLQDEIQINQGLVYEKHSGNLIGYIDLDDTANELEALQNTMNGTGAQLASNMLVIMVRGAANSLKYPYACFATAGVSGAYLYPILWKAIRDIELLCGLRVLFITCDGASPNRKFFRYNQVPGEDLVYWCWNRYSYPMRKLYFVCDVPHLLKTARNCFASSNCHQKTRTMWKNGFAISWQHIVDLFEQHVDGKIYSEAHKLTRSHVELTAFNKMKVRLAVQVFSKTVAGALERKYGQEVTETVKFIRHMNRFFDCLNVRNLQENVRKRNPDLKEYRDINDERLRYLREEFLGFFVEWEQSVNASWPQLSKEEKNRLMLSHQTMLGLRISVNSICEIVEFLLNEGAPFVLTHHFNQDPIEEHFSHCRHKGGANNNPTVQDFQNSSAKLRVIGSSVLAPVKGNITKRRQQRDQVDHTPLAKRRRTT